MIGFSQFCDQFEDINHEDIDDVAKIIEAFLDENTIVLGTTTKSIVYLSF